MSIFRKKNRLGLYLDRNRSHPPTEQTEHNEHTCDIDKLNNYHSDAIINKKWYKKLGSIPKKLGTFAYVTKDGYVYIGSSKNVNSRIFRHKHYIEHDIDKVLYIETSTEYNARKLEKIMIKDLNPELNRYHR